MGIARFLSEARSEDSIDLGKQLDHYRIESVVAQSGMASIFRVTDLLTGCTVAIKVPHPKIESNPVLFERFRREEKIGKTLIILE